jgi:soluble P-type ATPase
VFIKGYQALESSRAVDTVVLDKTGTVTTGQMTLTGVFTTPGTTRAELLALAGAVEHASEHAVAAAIAAAAARDGDGLAEVTDFAALPGLGASGLVAGHQVVVGREMLFARRGLDVPGDVAGWCAGQEQQGRTSVLVCWDGEIRGALAVTDTVKPSAPAAVAELRRLGLRPVLLTGDNEATAGSVAAVAGIDEVISGTLPDGKAEVIAGLEAAGCSVAMVGDGVNDGPALARAQLGLALGSGTDVAICAADMIVLRDDLMAVPDAIRLARATYRTIRANLVWAFCYNLLALPLAAAGFLNPLVAAATMTLSSVFVVWNSLRLRRFTGTPAGDLARAALDQAGRHDVHAGLGGVPVNPPEQDLGGEGADAGDVLGDDGDRGIEHVGERDVVEADQGDLVLQAVGAQCPDGTEGDQVLAAEDGGGPLTARQQRPDGGLGRLGGVQVAVDRSGRQSGPPQRVLVAGVPVGGGGDRGEVAEERDGAVPVRDQVLDAAGGALPVVGQDAVGRQQDRGPVGEHHGGAHGLLVAQVAVIPAGRDDDQPVHPPRDQRGGHLAFTGGVFLQAAGQQADPALPGHVLDRAVDAGRVGVADVLEHEPDHERAAVAAAQVAGGHVMPVVELGGRPADPGGQRGVHGRLGVDHPGYGLQTHPGQRGDVPHGGPSGRRRGCYQGRRQDRRDGLLLLIAVHVRQR